MKQDSKTDATPGTWSTDAYIRAWAKRRGMSLIALQSVQGFWTARIHFDRTGEPVERLAEQDVSGHRRAAAVTESACD